MNFQDFLYILPKLVNEQLPALEAHLKMAPTERIESLKNLSLEGLSPKDAAVLMLFYPKDGSTHLVLIVRNSYEGVHSAQISFPGGKYESKDKTFEITALRETYEEIGIHPDRIEIVRPFTKLYIHPSNFMVYPFLGVCREEINFILDETEVADVIELPLSYLLSDTIIVNTKMTTSYAVSVDIPAFKIEENIVWGATAMMLNELKEVLKKVQFI